MAENAKVEALLRQQVNNFTANNCHHYCKQQQAACLFAYVPLLASLCSAACEKAAAYNRKRQRLRTPQQRANKGLAIYGK